MEYGKLRVVFLRMVLKMLKGTKNGKLCVVMKWGKEWGNGKFVYKK